MPIYDRPIDSTAFQPLTTASSMENYGVGNMILDAGLAMGVESLGAGLMGAPGIFKGKPLMSMIPGVSPGGSGTTAQQLYHGMRHAGRGFAPAGPVTNVPVWNPGAPLDLNAPAVADHTPVRHTSAAQANQRVRRAMGGRKASPTNILRALSADSELQTKANMGLANRLGIGMGLRAFSQAWIFNDLFSMGFSAASSAIQGIESFSYERRARLQNEGGLSADLGEGFADTRASFTQRQRAMQAIHNSQMNTRAAMGNEATFMHV